MYQQKRYATGTKFKVYQPHPIFIKDFELTDLYKAGDGFVRFINEDGTYMPGSMKTSLRMIEIAVATGQVAVYGEDPIVPDQPAPVTTEADGEAEALKKLKDQGWREPGAPPATVPNKYGRGDAPPADPPPLDPITETTPFTGTPEGGAKLVRGPGSIGQVGDLVVETVDGKK